MISPKKVWLVIAVLAAGVVMLGLYGRFFAGPELPPAQPYHPTPSISTGTTTPTPAQSGLPNQINLSVPFTSQAPYQNWDQPYEDFCEEASVLMAIQYIRGQGIPDPDFADQHLMAIRDFELKEFGDYKDTNARQTAIILTKYFNYSRVKVITNPTAEDIKNFIAQRKVVLVPAAGRDLHNPYFKQPGPLYHMVVIKGYTSDNQFITNDPGTRRGADFIYTEDVIMNAMHDWNGGDVENGAKVIIVVG